MGHRRNAIGISLDFRTRASRGTADHIPNDDAINLLFAFNDVRAEAGVYPGPGIVTRIRAGVGADAPNDEFLRVWRTLKDDGVVAIHAPLKLNHRRSAVRQRYRIVVAVGFACRFPAIDESLILHEIEDRAHEFTLLTHGGGELAPDSFHGPAKQTAVVKLFFAEAVGPQFMRLGLEDFRIFQDEPPKIVITLARYYAHAATVTLASIKTGSKMQRAKCLTTGTTTPSPVRW